LFDQPIRDAQHDMGPVGIVGLGFIGTALAERLLEAGYTVYGFDVDAGKLARVAPRLLPAASVSDLAACCRSVVIAVYDTAQATQVIEGHGGLLEKAPPGSVVICVTTCEPRSVAALAERARTRGTALIEFPLSGNSSQVRDGKALALVAGDAAEIARAGALLQALCPVRFPIGRPGDAARAKLAVNLVLQLNRAALAEGLVFAQTMGLEPAAFLRVLSASPARSDVMQAKGQKMLSGDFSPQSRIAQTLKDSLLMLDEARRLGLRLPLMEANVKLLEKSIEIGGPDRDSCAVIDAIRPGA
jgi:3-hydroxyisobutyrate dehydrogenase-like beta-hydroxyacid dehydrogenase